MDASEADRGHEQATWVRPSARRHAVARRVVVGMLGVVAAVGVAGWLAHPWLLMQAARFLIVAEAPRPADAIVVLGGDWKGRLEKGVSLYRQGLAPYLVVTGGYWVAANRTQASYLAELAAFEGVPGTAILREDRSESTWEDARYTLELAQARGFRRVLLVTSDWHSRRAASVFRRQFAPHGIEVISVPSPEWRFDTLRWWQYPDGGEMVVIEWVRLIWYWLRYR